MASEDLNIEKFKKVTPQELNRELRSFVRKLPPFIPLFGGDIESLRRGILPTPEQLAEQEKIAGEAMLHRERSEYTKKLLEHLEGFLRLSYTTQSFRAFFRERFWAFGLLGYDPKKEVEHEPPTFRDLLDEGNPRSGGIFDPSRAREIELMAFRSLGSEYQDLERMGVKQILGVNPVEERYLSWKHELAEIHGPLS